LAQLEDLHIVHAAARRHSAEADDNVSSSVEEVEMGLLAGDERASSREGFGNGYGDESDDLEEEDAAVRNGGDGAKAKRKVPLTREDKKAIALLIVLCAFSVLDFVVVSLSGVFICRRYNPTRPFSLIFYFPPTVNGRVGSACVCAR
jgi:hypothetical protein